ncbi:phosphatidylglycerol lysyltransferase domain-containing protein [Tepidamorphus sp. 3E244]|uniref:phosphatidylglycerol lysyltransferase domain-containing protein n=1 Tax=Tepidamorphus sp. 3E244 TaxID=3385498 RepID=UPI0038FCE1E7
MTEIAAQQSSAARERLFRWIAAGASLIVFGAALFALNRLLADVKIGEVLNAFSSVERDALLLSILFTALSYITLTGYDAVALKHLNLKVPYGHTALASFTSYAFSNNIGLALLTGGSIRYRIYSLEGLTAVDIAALTGISTLTFMLGALAALGIALCVEPDTLATIDRLPISLNRLIGFTMLGLLAIYCIWVSWKQRAVMVRGFRLRLPGAGLTLGQIGIAVTDIVFASAALYVLMPEELGVEYTTFAGIFVAAITLGILAHTPGGIGVFEAMILLALPYAPPDVLLGRLILFRCVYYLLPLGVAAGLFALNEALHPGGVARRMGDRALVVGGAAAPQLLGVVVLACGALVLLSGAATPNLPNFPWLAGLVPVWLRDFAHLAAGLAGVALVILSRGLFRRLTRAWRFAVIALGVAIFAVILRGFDFEEAGILVFALFVLLGTRRGFARRGRVRSQTYSAPWIAVIITVIGFTLWLGVLAYGQHGLDPQALLRYGADENAARFMRTSLAVVIVAVVFVAVTALRLHEPALTPPVIPHAVRAIVRRSADPTARLAFAGDKRFLVDDADTAFLMYAVQRRTWLAIGMPQGAPDAIPGLLWRFRELAEAEGGIPAFFNVAESDGKALEEIGLSLSHIGDRASLPCTDGLSRDIALPEGWSVETASEREPSVPRARLLEIDAAWQQRHPFAEKGVLQGQLDATGEARGDLVLLKRGKQVEGFAVVWNSRTGEAVLDLLRLSREAEEEDREALLRVLVETALSHAARIGAQTLRLGLIPPKGLDTLLLAPALKHAGPGFWSHGGHFPDADALRAFMESFGTDLQPRYLASTGGIPLSAAVLDAATLLTGHPPPRRTGLNFRAETSSA